MSDMRRYLTLVEGINEQIVDEATLYRGDSTRIDLFSLAATDKGALFGKGIYLTDDRNVAGDYTVKASKHVVYAARSNKSEKPARSEAEIVAMYLRHIMDEKLGRQQKAQKIKSDLMDQFYAGTIAKSDCTPEHLKAQIKALNSDLMREARAIYKDEAPDLRVICDTTGEYKIVKKDRTGFITTFEVPDEYLAKCLHAEQPLPDLVLAALREMFIRGNPNQTMDMRDANENFCTFDKWVKAYKGKGIAWAWRDDEDRIVRGSGNPTLDALKNGTHIGGLLWYEDEFQNAFIARMQALGYVGLAYDGGKRIGQYVQGGGGLQHRAYCFWDAEALAHFRREANPVSDPSLTAGIERGIRASRGLYALSI